MINYFDELYSKIVDKNKFIARMKIYSIQRLLIRMIANLIIPIYYSLKQSQSSEKLGTNLKPNNRIIVSLTSFPKRINKLWIVIESLLMQTHKPDMIILWLSRNQFDSKDKLPKKLLLQQKRGLEIRFCDGDFKSHKKYFYTLKEYPNDFIITVDDDIVYHTTMIEQLVSLNLKYPNSVCCHRACCLITVNNKLLPYTDWPELFNDIGPSHRIFQTSGGGTLFPPHSLHEEVVNESVFKNICIDADDIWLNVMIKLNNTTIVKSNFNSGYLPIIYFNNVNLYSTNLILGNNDIQIERVRNYYKNKLGIDPLNTLFV